MRREGVETLTYELWYTDDRARVNVEAFTASTDAAAIRAAREILAARKKERAAHAAALGFAFRCRRGWFQLRALRNVDLDIWVVAGKTGDAGNN